MSHVFKLTPQATEQKMKKIEGAANKLETIAQIFAVVTCHMFILSMCVVTEGIWKQRQLLFN